jgi:ADP-heptose:LPS heptosyltransferase
MPQKDYIVIHPGGGAGFKAWPPDHWRSLVQALSTRGHCIVLTGRGAVERATIEAIIENMPGCLNLCDVLNWEQFIEILQNARLLIGIDSVAGHLAAAVDTPSVLIYTGTANLKNFGPLSEKCDLLIYPVPCSPCFLANGCEGMECVRWLTVDAVLEATLRALARCDKA